MNRTCWDSRLCQARPACSLAQKPKADIVLHPCVHITRRSQGEALGCRAAPARSTHATATAMRGMDMPPARPRLAEHSALRRRALLRLLRQEHLSRHQVAPRPAGHGAPACKAERTICHEAGEVAGKAVHLRCVGARLRHVGAAMNESESAPWLAQPPLSPVADQFSRRTRHQSETAAS